MLALLFQTQGQAPRNQKEALPVRTTERGLPWRMTRVEPHKMGMPRVLRRIELALALRRTPLVLEWRMKRLAPRRTPLVLARHPSTLQELEPPTLPESLQGRMAQTETSLVLATRRTPLVLARHPSTLQGLEPPTLPESLQGRMAQTETSLVLETSTTKLETARRHLKLRGDSLTCHRQCHCQCHQCH